MFRQFSFSGGKLKLLVIFSESAKGLCFIFNFSLVTDINPALVKVWFLIFDYPIRVIVIFLAIAFYNYGCAINKERVFFTVEPCLEYYFAWEVTVDVCLHASKANKCASVSGKPFYYVKKCLIYTSRDSHAGCFWMSASAKKVITEDSKVTPQSYEGANCDLLFQLIISHG